MCSPDSGRAASACAPLLHIAQLVDRRRRRGQHPLTAACCAARAGRLAGCAQHGPAVTSSGGPLVSVPQRPLIVRQACRRAQQCLCSTWAGCRRAARPGTVGTCARWPASGSARAACEAAAGTSCVSRAQRHHSPSAAQTVSRNTAASPVHSTCLAARVLRAARQWAGMPAQQLRHVPQVGPGRRLPRGTAGLRPAPTLQTATLPAGQAGRLSALHLLGPCNACEACPPVCPFLHLRLHKHGHALRLPVGSRKHSRGCAGASLQRMPAVQGGAAHSGGCQGEGDQARDCKGQQRVGHPGWVEHAGCRGRRQLVWGPCL